MTKEQREEIRTRIISAINWMTSDESNKDSSVTIGGHTISRRLLYAGGSQWCGCGRDWDTTESGWAWVIDDQYHLTTPDLFGFDGHNIIERQTPYYLQDGYDEQTTPEHDGRDSIERVPGRVLIEIAKALVEAIQAAKEMEELEAEEATKLLGELV